MNSCGIIFNTPADKEEYFAIQKWLLTKEAYLEHHTNLHRLETISPEKNRISTEICNLAKYLKGREISDGLTSVIMISYLTRLIQMTKHLKDSGADVD